MSHKQSQKQQKQLITQFNKLQLYRAPKPKTHKQIQIVFQDIAEEHYHQHYGIALFATIGLNPKQPLTIIQEWNAFVNIMPKILDTIDKNYVISGLMIGIELYQKNKNRANNKSFKPHVHIVIFAVNAFMASPEYQLRTQLIQLGLDVKVDQLPEPKDVANAMRYTIKSANDLLTNKATQVFFAAPPASLLINTAVETNPLLRLETFIHQPTIPITIVKKQLYWKCPSVTRHNQPKYSAAEYLAKICRQQRIGFYNDVLLKRIPGAHFTWQSWKPVHEFIDALAKENKMPPGYKEFFLDNAAWIIKEGATSTTKPIHTVFPRVAMAPHLWEFQNGHVYNFNTDELQAENIAAFMSCSKFVDLSFSDLPQPTRLINFINILTGKHSITNELLKTMGGLFHSLTTSRKVHKALWLYGQSDTYKTWLIATFLEKCFHELLIYRIPQTPTAFQFARLRNAGEGVVFIDDFRTQGFKNNTPAFLNIVDGMPTQAEEKYKPSELIKYKGHFAITSNEQISNTNFKYIDKQALKKRFEEIQFVSVKQKNPYKLNFHDNEWFALAIAANKLYLQAHNTKQSL